MESAALNRAHEVSRRADALAQAGRFEEASKYHEKAACLLESVKTKLSNGLLIQNSTFEDYTESLQPRFGLAQKFNTLESLSLQIEYNKRQVAVVRMKQAEYEESKRNKETQKLTMMTQLMNNVQEQNGTSSASEKSKLSLKQAIYKTIEQQDSLLNLMTVSDDKGVKLPKDPGTVIEELHTINKHLRTLVGSLLNQLETKEHEVRVLTSKLQGTSGNLSTDEISIRLPRLAPLPPLPPLTPLEMPRFDFNSS